MSPSQVRNSSDHQIAVIYEHLLAELKDHAVFTISPDSVLISWNVGVERILGYSRTEFIGQPASILFTPEDISSEIPREEMREAARTGRVESHRYQVRQDGSAVYVEGSITAVRDEHSGTLIGYLKVLRDDTERTLVKTGLEERERDYHFLAESIPEIVWTAKPDGTVDYYNQHWYQFTGLERENSGGWDWQAVVHPEDSERVLSRWKRSLETGEPLDVECRLRRADGVYLYHIRRATAQKDDPGNVRKWVGTCTDIDSQKQTDRALRQSAKLESIGVLAGGVAHDFNNLLTGILGNTSIALEILPASHPVRGILEAAMQASRNAAELTQQLLAYAGKGRIVLAPVNFTDVVRDSMGLIRTSIPANVELRVDLTGNLPLVEGDFNQMQQILMNLIINGAEAIENVPGTVTVKTCEQDVDKTYIRNILNPGAMVPGRYVAVEVRDTGSGMDDATIARIFDPFFTTKFTGRGLGLAAVLGMVRSHKGGIKVLSTPGEGSTFRLLFPVIRTTAEARTAMTPERKNVTGKGTVLVVDDQAAVRDVARSALERYGYSVITAENGRDAVDLFRQIRGQVTLILLDLTMPVMNGEEALRHLRDIQPDIKVILSSGYSEMDAVRMFAGKNLAGFLQKPYTAKRLGEAVQNALQQQPGTQS